MQGDILNNLLFLVHITFWQGNILFSFKVKFCSIDITPALPLRNSEERPRYIINFSTKTLSDMNLITGLVHNSSSDKLQPTIQTSHPLLTNRHILSTDQSSKTLVEKHLICSVARIFHSSPLLLLYAILAKGQIQQITQRLGEPPLWVGDLLYDRKYYVHPLNRYHYTLLSKSDMKRMLTNAVFPSTCYISCGQNIRAIKERLNTLHMSA